MLETCVFFTALTSFLLGKFIKIYQEVYTDT